MAIMKKRSTKKHPVRTKVLGTLKKAKSIEKNLNKKLHLSSKKLAASHRTLKSLKKSMIKKIKSLESKIRTMHTDRLKMANRLAAKDKTIRAAAAKITAQFNKKTTVGKRTKATIGKIMPHKTAVKVKRTIKHKATPHKKVAKSNVTVLHMHKAKTRRPTSSAKHHRKAA